SGHQQGRIGSISERYAGQHQCCERDASMDVDHGIPVRVRRSMAASEITGAPASRSPDSAMRPPNRWPTALRANAETSSGTAAVPIARAVAAVQPARWKAAGKGKRTDGRV